MKKNTKVVDIIKAKESVIWSPLEEVVRKGAIEMLQAALEVEVEEFLEKYEFRKDEKGRHLVERNGYMPEMELITGIGKIEIKQPRVDDRGIRTEMSESVFTSSTMPSAP